MITILHDADATERDRILSSDPFQHAEPSWRTRISHLLPPETQTTVVRLSPTEEIKKLMAIKIVQESQAPARLFKIGTISSKQDYADVINAMRTMKAGEAVIVDMDAKAWEGVKKPETAFANNLRRMFDIKGLPLTAYRSGAYQITVRKANALDPRKKSVGKK